MPCHYREARQFVVDDWSSDHRLVDKIRGRLWEEQPQPAHPLVRQRPYPTIVLRTKHGAKLFLWRRGDQSFAVVIIDLPYAQN